MPIGDPPNYFGGPAVLAEKRMPTRQELDRAAPANPVYICAPFGYWGEPPTYGVLNSEGLRRNRIDRASKAGVNGIEIVRDGDGEPTGVIINKTRSPAAEFDLLPDVPRFGFEERAAALQKSMKLYHACGTTSVYEGHGEAPESIAVYRHLWSRGALTMRAGLVVSPTWASLGEAVRDMRDRLSFARGSGIGDSMLRISGIFVNFGGDPAVAALSRNRLPDTGWSGQVETASTPAEFEELCMLAGRYDLRMHTLASDSLTPVVTVLKRVAERYPIGERRWVVEHIGPSRSEDLVALKALGVLVTLIPANYLWKGARYAGLAPEAAELLSPAKQLIELGVPASAGTDNIPYNPFFTAWSMVTREEMKSKRVFGAAARLSNAQALRLLTVGGARLTFEEYVKGPLIAGRYADLMVLPQDPLSADAATLMALRPEATMVAGKLVHGDLPE
ncbi:putative amidohydrolase YtcJ [Nitrobacteraceae bacterium AZCC 2161]